MVLRSLTLILALCFSLNNVKAQEFDLNSPEVRDQVKEMLKQSYREYRKARKKKDQPKSSQTFEFRLDELSPSPCVNCAKVLELSRGVTDVLAHMSEQLPLEHQQKIQELIAVDVYTQKIDEMNEQDCHRARIFDLTDEFLQYDIDQAIVLHSQSIDLNHLISFRMQGRSQYQQTLFLRGQDEDSNRLIRVDFSPPKQPLVTIYQLNPETNPPVKHALIKDRADDSLPDLMQSDAAPLVTNRPSTEKSDESVPEENLRYFEYESDRYGLPKKITLLEFKHNAQLSDDVRIKNELEISTSDQELVTEITDQSGRQYARFIIDKEAQLKTIIPYGFQALDTQWQGEVQLDKDGLTSFVNLNHSQQSKTRIGHTSSIGMTTLEHTRQINSYSQLTLRLSDGQRGQQSVTLNYRIVLD